MDSYLPRQISQSDWEIGSNCGKIVFRRAFTSTSGRHLPLNFPCQRSSLSMKLSFVSDRVAKSFIFVTVLVTLVWKGQTRCPKDYDSPRGLCTGQIYDFHFQELLVYFEFRLSSRSAMFLFFICRVAGLRESQSQALNSNLLREKLKLQW